MPKRIPRNYNGTQTSLRQIKNLVKDVLNDIDENYNNKPKKIIESWPKIIGDKLAPMTEVVNFKKGVLIVSVKSATLYSLFAQYEKARILKILQEKFSREIIRDIKFIIG
jgi:hypothetical protein